MAVEAARRAIHRVLHAGKEGLQLCRRCILWRQEFGRFAQTAIGRISAARFGSTPAASVHMGGVGEERERKECRIAAH